MSTQIEATDINNQGHLLIGGVDSVTLANDYGTPLIAYDVSEIRQQIQHFKKIFDRAKVKHQISYASKAFATVAMYQLVKQEHIHCDVVSGGEMYTALKAGFPMDKISFHGNNKSRAELEFALEHKVGCIIVDNFHEIDLLQDLTRASQQPVNIMLRVTPGISAHTHEYVMTGQEDSKFGFDIKSGQAQEAMKKSIGGSIFKSNWYPLPHWFSDFSIDGFVLAAQKNDGFSFKMEKKILLLTFQLSTWVVVLGFNILMMNDHFNQKCLFKQLSMR